MAVLASQQCHPLGILYRFGIGELLFHLSGARKRIGEAITETQVSDVAEAAGEAGVLLA